MKRIAIGLFIDLFFVLGIAGLINLLTVLFSLHTVVVVGSAVLIYTSTTSSVNDSKK